MKIALLTDVYKICGVSNLIYHLVEYCKRNEIELTIFAIYPENNSKNMHELKGGKTVKLVKLLPKFSLEIYPDLFVDFTIENSRIINEEFEKSGFDVIISPTPSTMALRAVQLSKRFKIPLVSIYTTRIPEYVKSYFNDKMKTDIFDDMLKDLTWNFIKYFYNNSTMVLATTPSMKKTIEKRIDVPIEVYTRGVDTKKFSPKFRKNHEKIRLLYAGRVSVEKNLQLLKEVLKEDILPNYKNVEVWIVGDGPYKEIMEKEFKEAKYTGFLTGKDFSEAMASADIFVFASKTETFGQVVVQAMASGVPVVAMNAEGPNYIIKDGETGFLCKNRQEFTEKIKILIENHDLRKKIGEAGIKGAKKFDWNKVNDGLMVILDELIKD